ncbi:MAG: M20/M25/M40 family metallo-hydrolase [bacterium]|nr:M20/M25/M40 family metallo-hydrolase [bacterium]
MAIERLNQIVDKKDRELAILLQNLIRIPSWVPQEPAEAKLTQNENNVVDFLEDWIRSNTQLKVERQKLEGGRFNLIASLGKPNLVFLGHTDTVAPSQGSPFGQLEAEIHDGKIWGRGSTDMKSGIASMIQALSLTPETKNVWVLFYADEEYDFLGMKALVKDYSDLRPKLIISSDGGNLSIGHGCRGLIEFRAQIKGITGHAAKGNGLNAIDGTFQSMIQLKKYLNNYKHPVMGPTSMNLAYLLGGQEQDKKLSYRTDGRLINVGQEGNVIPDIAEFVVDIRPSSPDLTAQKILKQVTNNAKEHGYVLENVTLRHQLGAWYTDLSEIKEYVEIAKESIKQKSVNIEKPGENGYLDLQMLWEATGRPKAFMFGGGESKTAHKPDEHIKIENLIKERDFFRKILEKHSTK